MDQVTVVITVNDKKAFQSDHDRLFESYKNYNTENPPANAVTAFSNSNEFRRLELLEEAMCVDSPDLARECANHILAHTDISKINNFKDVLQEVSAC